MDRPEFLARYPASVPGPRPAVLGPSLPNEDLIDLFCGRLAAVAGVVHGPVPVGSAADLIVGILTQYGSTTYLAWDDPGVPAVHPRLRLAGLRRIDGDVPMRDPARRRHLQGYQHVDAGITGADAGLAESGSIVLRTGPGRPRLASLIPVVHVAVLTVRRIARSLAHYAIDHPAAIEGTSNLVVITGPSRTADIEQQLNLGVHGPKHLHVILVD